MTILIEGRIMRAPAVSAPAPPICDDDLSNRIVIWQGDISTLEVDVVINITDEVTACTNPGERIPGTESDLKEEILNNGYAVWGGGGGVRAAVALYSRLHHHHCLTALHNCYTKALYVCAAAGSVALSPLAGPRAAGFPPDLAAHLAIRTIRRFLEQHKFPQLVVLTSQVSADTQLLSTIAAQYFPKHTVDDRRIRIIHNPHTHTDSAEDDTSLCDEEASMLAAARLSVDTQRLLTDTRQPGVLTSQNQQYEQLLRRARTEDLSEVSGIGCLYQSGVDRLGRPVVVFIGKWFPIGDIDLDKALLFLIKLLDPIVRGDYVIAYFHTMASSGNHPPFSWLKEVYTVLPYKYKKNLKAFYIVHPTFWTKMMTWWFTTFMAPAIKAKVHSLPGVEYLYSVMARDQLELPAFVTEYDMTINGLHYFQPDTNNT